MFKLIAQVRRGGVREELHWDGARGFMLEARFDAMGQSSSSEKTPDEARRVLEQWGQLDQLDDDFEVLHADREALDEVMEGVEWHPLMTR